MREFNPCARINQKTRVFEFATTMLGFHPIDSHSKSSIGAEGIIDSSVFGTVLKISLFWLSGNFMNDVPQIITLMKKAMVKGMKAQ